MMASRRRLVLLGSLGLIACIFLGLGLFVNATLNRPLLSPGAEAQIITVNKSSTASELFLWMQDKHLLRSSKFWIKWIQLQGLSSKLKAGIYQIKIGESLPQLIHRIVAGDVLHLMFLIKPGHNRLDIIQDLKSAPYLAYMDTDWQILDTPNPSFEIPQDLRASAQAYEGSLLAQSYQYNAGSSAKALLSMAHAHLLQALSKAWASRQPGLPYHSPYQLLIAASIIEKESALAAERRLISGVIVNRLRRNMPLQMDPTVIYALGADYHGALSHDNMSVDSPYNTYKYFGLPPTPIATVSEDALIAASNPDQSAYLYFVAKGDGSHEFSKTYLQHRRAIQAYERRSQ